MLGFGYNTELVAKNKMPEPKCWKDLTNPAYRNEIQMANPGTSGTAFNTVSTILQMMGEDEGFKYLAALNKNINQYTRSGSAGIRAAAKGETTIGITFLHDAVAQTVQGYPIKAVAPCEGTGYEIISSAIIKGGPNPEGARKWMDFVLSPAGQNVAVVKQTEGRRGTSLYEWREFHQGAGTALVALRSRRCDDSRYGGGRNDSTTSSRLMAGPRCWAGGGRARHGGGRAVEGSR